MASRIACALVLALLLAGCKDDDRSVANACLDGPAKLERALAGAPGPVALTDGTRLSQCLARARTDAELQVIGSSLMIVADRLAVRAPRDRAAALRLGYLAGAARRGVRSSPGLATQIGRRIEKRSQLAGASAATRSALARGLRAGEDGG